MHFSDPDRLMVYGWRYLPTEAGRWTTAAQAHGLRPGRKFDEMEL